MRKNKDISVKDKKTIETVNRCYCNLITVTAICLGTFQNKENIDVLLENVPSVLNTKPKLVVV